MSLSANFWWRTKKQSALLRYGRWPLLEMVKDINERLMRPKAKFEDLDSKANEIYSLDTPATGISVPVAILYVM
jgi:hypothetical protein